MNLRDLLTTTMDQFAGSVRGLVIDHDGQQAQIIFANGRWQAIMWAFVGTENGHTVDAFGDTPAAALACCAAEVEAAESRGP